MALKLEDPYSIFIKIPALVKPDGSSIFDSSVIAQYLDSLVSTEKRLLPPVDDPKRYAALTTEALCDGILEAAILRRYESFRVRSFKLVIPWHI